jgi:hypothetical protein
MSDPRENCPWKCKYCECYNGALEGLRCENTRLRSALTDVVFALDGVIDGDFTANGKTARSALETGVRALDVRRDYRGLQDVEQ